MWCNRALFAEPPAVLGLYLVQQNSAAFAPIQVTQALTGNGDMAMSTGASYLAQARHLAAMTLGSAKAHPALRLCYVALD